MNIPPEKYHLCPKYKNDIAYGEDCDIICEKCFKQQIFFERIKNRESEDNTNE